MADVVIGNVILTATLVVALLLFVASASGLATIYTIRVRQTLLQNQATQVAQLVQQVYLLVNTTQIPSNTNYVLKSLDLPNQLDGYPYTLILSTTQTKTGLVTLTVTLTLTATYGQASSTVLMGRNFALTKNPSTTQGTTIISAQLYKCAGNTGNQPTSGPVCTGQPANEVVLQLQGVINTG